MHYNETYKLSAEFFRLVFKELAPLSLKKQLMNKIIMMTNRLTLIMFVVIYAKHKVEYEIWKQGKKQQRRFIES